MLRLAGAGLLNMNAQRVREPSG